VIDERKQVARSIQPASVEAGHAARPRGISGARILELGGWLAAPFSARLLTSLGAEVIKVESLRGDEMRNMSQTNTTFITWNAGKKSIAVDLKTDSGAEVFARLVHSADVVLNNLSERATEQLRVAYDDCRRIKPDIVYAQITGFGDGPYAGRSATQAVIEAMVGTTSNVNGKPTRMGGGSYDQMAGAMAALAVVAALGNDSAEARNIRIGLFEVALYVDRMRLQPRRTGQGPDRSGGSANPAYDSFHAADGWVYINGSSEPLWRKLCGALGLEQALADPTLATTALRQQHPEEVTALLAGAIEALPSQQVIDRLTAAGVPCVPVHEHDDVLQDPQVRRPGKLTATRFGEQVIEVGAFPVVGAGARYSSTEAAPLLGEHSIEILQSLAYDADACDDLVLRGVVLSA
jgi:crotonobetainyl-CoA:carnitine CoA-transferase CaiB-like acyl-CoA transferase